MKKSDFCIPDGKMKELLKGAEVMVKINNCNGVPCGCCPLNISPFGEDCWTQFGEFCSGGYKQNIAKQFIELFGGSMKFQEAFKKMLKGEKVRCVTFIKEEFYLCEKGNTIVDEDGDKYLPTLEEVCADWKIYREPTPKKVITVKGKEYSESTLHKMIKAYTE